MHFSLDFRYKFEAAHRFTKSCSHSCATPHGHTWYAKARLKSWDKHLKADDMVTEFSVLKSKFKVLIDRVFDHSYLCNADDKILPALREHIPHLRVVEFPCDPTTEIIAELLGYKFQLWLEQDGLAEIVCVSEIVIEETPTNHVSVSLGFGEKISDRFPEIDGWWKRYDPLERLIHASHK